MAVIIIVLFAPFLWRAEKAEAIPLKMLFANAKQLAEKGVKEIVLTGINLGDFGQALSTRERDKDTSRKFLSNLLKQLDEVEGIERYRISSIEPNLLTNEIIEFVAQQ